jgi:hypothetical protein
MMADEPEQTPSRGPEDGTDAPPLDLPALRLRTDERGRMFILREGHADQQVVARRAFPWSRPDQFISLRGKEGGELAMIESLTLLPDAAQAQILAFLAAGTFIPRIRRITRIDMQHGYQLWDVETEAGSLQLRVQEREDIRFLSETRFSVKDANGNVYEIPDVSELDEGSQRELSRVV